MRYGILATAMVVMFLSGVLIGSLVPDTESQVSSRQLSAMHKRADEMAETYRNRPEEFLELYRNGHVLDKMAIHVLIRWQGTYVPFDETDPYVDYFCVDTERHRVAQQRKRTFLKERAK